MTTQRANVRILNPTAEIKAAVTKLASRPGKLNGKTIALLNNHRPNADVILSVIGERLKNEHDIAGFVQAEKWKSNMPFPKEVVDEVIGKCSAVVEALCS